MSPIDLLDTCTTFIGKQLLKSGELRPTPKVLDRLYGNRDGTLDGEDIVHYTSETVENVEKVVDIVKDVTTTILDTIF